MSTTIQLPDSRAFGPVPKTGVIYVMERAAAAGFTSGDPSWANLGQGAPETGPLPDSPPRLDSIPVATSACEYAPVGGHAELRQAVASLYNRRYRQGKASRYGPENVAISAGGRTALTRVAAALDRVHLGHFLPDYTAYEELLDLFRDFLPIPILNKDRRLPDAARLREEIIGRGLGALLLSNPCNPTGDVVFGDELERWVQAGRETGCALIFDEFYSHYLYGEAASVGTNSAARHVDDVNADAVLVVDGLTKNWRYPGLRLSWTLGPARVIQALSSAGSFLDGGAPHPIQAAAVDLIEPERADLEAKSIQAEFSAKRRYMVDRVRAMGMRLEHEPLGGFYCFVSLEDLPTHLSDGTDFMEAALEREVITIPGRFFDVNPGKRRDHIPSRLSSFVRLSFGPAMAELERGLDRLEELCAS